jgi:hypothetical protein
MNRRHHATRAAASELDRRQRKSQKPDMPLDSGPLFIRQGRCRSSGQDQQLLFVVMQLDGIAGEVRNLIAVEFDYCFAARFQLIANLLSLPCVND